MTDFARLMSDYFVKYLAGQKGSGSNTMKTYRDTFVQLLEFMDEKKPDIYKGSPRSHICDYDRDLFQSKSGSKKKTHRRCIPNTGHQP